MKIYKCGSKATTVIGKIEGIITGICIRFKKVQYEISYFHEGKHQSIWLEECEIICQEKQRVTIGFNK